MVNNQNDQNDKKYQGEISFIYEAFRRVQESRNPTERMMVIAHLFFHLAVYPLIVEDFSNFRHVITQKAVELFDEAEFFKEKSVSEEEGGAFDHEMFDAAGFVQMAIGLFKERIACS